MLMMSSVKVFLPNAYSTSSLFMLMMMSSVNAFLPTSLFQHVYSLHISSIIHDVWFTYARLCLTFFIQVVCFLEFFHCCVSLCCVEYDLDKWSIQKPFSPVITHFITRNKCSIIWILALRWFELSSSISTHFFSTDISIVMLA